MAALPPGDTANSPGTMAAKPPEAEATPSAGPQPPTFDVVRVEADGSAVIAGKALPNSLVELLNGETVLGSAKATSEGDFVIVLDEPLKPGAYQITLRSTPEGGTAVASLQTAVLAIPDKPDGQVLAMVEQPGKASELLSVPQPDASAQPKSDQASTQPSAGAEKQGDTGSAPAGTPSPAQAAKTNEAAAPAQTAPSGEANPAEAKVAVQAVEIEGRKIFVAGVGQAGRYVRVYANEMLLGEAKVGEGGRFLVEAQRDLPVGQYTIRADMLDGATVIARAAVPFEREPGEAMAAVVPNGKSGQASAPAAASSGPSNEGSQPTAAQDKSPPANKAGSSQPAMAANETPPAAAAKPAEGAKGTEMAVASETVSPKLQKVQGAVIIRQGDTLWRISRRVYGHGTRYSSIYLANQTQIRDPDRIWPGQIFAVPDKSREGEPADMSGLVNQLVNSLPPE
ncbi:LysM peptidoglycan-binding domain-containing protein [Mesorhizobium sp. BAC0120]|uniref:LysM peptidoglycan-binding domain-containing protein n=1 Tax=Mesorhizobium sp. BAC0120 TaxID=3090670 RepID=UPI00298C515E|nr:LysM peptidoglycan-binding domain-containing protein [Mesorhizobium sp. BAC0120]MDW6021235.1 LysM peptidoglycan-binding domain-containing protein [Mesorhizobium sp. BAC0120]